MKIKGIRTVKPIVVDLSKFFESPQSVTVRALPPATRAKIQELTTNGMRYSTTQRKKSIDIDAIEQAMPAVITLEIREVKLRDGVIAHDFVDDDTGKPATWGVELWNALDEADPRINETIIDAISRATYPDDEEGNDPT